MALDREIEDIRSDAPRWRALALRIPSIGRDILSDWELDFVEEIPKRTWLDHLSHRQAEILLEIRDSVETVSSYRGRSVKWLCTACYENRLDLDGDEQAWITQLHNRNPSAVRRKEAGRLLRFARRLGLLDED